MIKLIRILVLLFFILCSLSCKKTIIIPAQKDAFLSNNMPDKNISGKNEPVKGKGFGTKKRVAHGYVTYPAMYLNSNIDGNVKDAFIVGGFDLSSIKGEIIHASLKFFINYASNTRKRICIFIRPIKEEWDENTITYLDIYKTAGPNAKLHSIVESDENKCILIIFDIKKNNEDDLTRIPFRDANRIVSINVTAIVKQWIKNPSTNHGFLIDPMWMDDFRYCTTNAANEISNFGIIEIGTTEWFDWEGKVPSYFYCKHEKWIDIENRAFGKIKYIPGLEIIF